MSDATVCHTLRHLEQDLQPEDMHTHTDTTHDTDLGIAFIHQLLQRLSVSK